MKRVLIHLLFVLLALPLGSVAMAQGADHPYTGFISEVQEKLRSLGFDPGPVNGDFGFDTQAALAQFQLSRTIPASGALDDLTLQELGVQRPQEAAEADSAATGG